MFDFKQFRKRHGLTQKEAAEMLEVSQTFISQIEKGIRRIPEDKLLIIKAKYNDLPPHDKRVPLYSDVSSNSNMVSEPDLKYGYSKNRFIDPGDLFSSVTAAFRHFGNSMTEYPSGSILALKKVDNHRLVIWGNDYMIETKEFRIVKRIQRGDDDSAIKAFSTNSSTYPSGQLVHEPMDIPWDDINGLYMVVGCIIKREGAS